jgi:hypothetical protein
MSYEATLLNTWKAREHLAEPVSAVVQIFILDDNKYNSDEDRVKLHRHMKSVVVSMMTPLKWNDKSIQFFPIGDKYLYIHDTHMDCVRSEILAEFESYLNKPEILTKVVSPENHIKVHKLSIGLLHFKILIPIPKRDIKVKVNIP